MPKNESELKWICPCCTYGNWPLATKCAMCLAFRTSSRSCRSTSPSNKGELIDTCEREESEYHDESFLPSDDIMNNRERSPPLGIENDLKWNCPSCSYFNWMKAEKCVMCSSIKPREFKRVEVLRNIENNGDNRNTADCKCESRTRTGPVSKNSKWICPKCTYENWPKSVKCVICQHSKNKVYIREDLASKHLNEKNGKLNERASNAKKSTSPKRSPPRSPNVISRQTSNNIFDIPKPGEDRIVDLAIAMEKLNSGVENQKIKQICNLLSWKDWAWLAACKGVVEHDLQAVSSYLSMGGDRARQITADDVLLLNEPGCFDVGHTLVHLSIKYHREDILRMLLKAEVPHRGTKKLPCLTCPELAMTIGKLFIHSMRSIKEDFPCPFFTELVTFSLPGELLEFDLSVQNHLFHDILDLDVQKVMEDESLINWSNELSNQYGSRIYPLWNRAAGDCLLDSVLQATWGVFDRDNALRKKLHDALSEGYHRFFPRWKEAEELQASEMNYSLEDDQWKHDWSNIVSLAASAGKSLEQAHVFALAHILRRPIIIYGVKFVKSFRGETIDLARFEGVYLPLLWEDSFCWKTPIALGYTRGHFSALVPVERANHASYACAGAHTAWNDDDAHVTYLPLIDHEGHLLPVHFLTVDEIGQEEQMLQKRLDCELTDGGILVAKQLVGPRPAIVNQMIDEWLHRYRKMNSDMKEAGLSARKS